MKSFREPIAREQTTEIFRSAYGNCSGKHDAVFTVDGIELTALLDDHMTENEVNFESLYKLKQSRKLQPCEQSTVYTDGGSIGIVGKFWSHVWTSNVMKQVQFLVSHDIGQSVILGLSFMEEHILGELPVEPRLVEEYCEDSDATSNVQHFPKTKKAGVLTTSLLPLSVGLSEIMSPQVKHSRSDQSNGINDSRTSSAERWLKIEEADVAAGANRSRCAGANSTAYTRPERRNAMPS